MLKTYVCAAYLLIPNPTIMAHANDPAIRDPEDCLTVEYFVPFLLLPITLITAEAREAEEASLLFTFWKALGWFQNRQKYFATKYIWVTADNDRLNTPELHKNYSVPYTDVICKVTCFVASKRLGIGEG